MLNDRHDEALFDGFESLTPTLAASQSAVERTRDLLLQWMEPCDTLATGRTSPALGGTPPRREASFRSINVKQPSLRRLLAYWRLGGIPCADGLAWGSLPWPGKVEVTRSPSRMLPSRMKICTIQIVSQSHE